MNIRNLKDQPLDEIQVKKAGRQIKGFLIWLLKVVIIVGISYIILGPLITIVANSFFTANDLYNPVVMLLPAEGTLQNYITSFTRMTYPRTLATTFAYVISLTLIQIFICSMAGYGFARYEFPFKKVLFGCVILTIVIPNDTLMLPLYTQFYLTYFNTASRSAIRSSAPSIPTDNLRILSVIPFRSSSSLERSACV